MSYRKYFASNFFKIMNISKLPVMGLNYGSKFMDTEGNVFSRVKANECSQNGNYLLYAALCGGTIETVVSIKNGQKTTEPIVVPNNVFADGKGNYFLRAHVKTEEEVAAKATGAGCGYIIVREDKPEAWINGEQVDFPKTLTNELGVAYMFVDYAQYGKVCKQVNGYCTAVKVEPVLVLDVAAGEKIQSVLNGVKEHDTFIEEGFVAVQNMYHGESYSMKVAKLQKLYEYSHTLEGGIQVWKPKYAVQEWTWTSENIFGVLWGGFEFLAKAMINITDPNDTYGCNYDVFCGDDIANGSHQKLAVFLPKAPLPKAWLQEAGELKGYLASEEAVPKFAETLFPLEAYALA